MREMAIFFAALCLGYWMGWGHGFDRATLDAERATAVTDPDLCEMPVLSSPRDQVCRDIFDNVSLMLEHESSLLADFAASPHD